MSELRDIPSGPHYAILRTDSVYIPGDERSRTNPGHGYPAETLTYISYQAFTNRADWEVAVKQAAQSHEAFRALMVTPARVSTDIHVKVDAP